jgi:hypothetical protein
VTAQVSVKEDSAVGVSADAGVAVPFSARGVAPPAPVNCFVLLQKVGEDLPVVRAGREFSMCRRVSVRFFTGPICALAPILYLLVFLPLLAATAPAKAQVLLPGAQKEFAATDVGASSAALGFHYSFSRPATIGDVRVPTQGEPNLDFRLASGSSCSTKTYSAGQNCTVNVMFTPRYPGARFGAVVLLDGNKRTLVTTYIHGIGKAPVPVFSPAVQTTLGIGLNNPNGMAPATNTSPQAPRERPTLQVKPSGASDFRLNSNPSSSLTSSPMPSLVGDWFTAFQNGPVNPFVEENLAAPQKKGSEDPDAVAP